MGGGANRRGDDWLFSLTLGLLSLLPRLYVALAWAREPVWDGQYYDFGARRIAEGFGYADEVVRAGVKVWHPWCHYPVGYSGLLAGVYRVFGQGQHVAPVVGAVVGALMVVLTHRVARGWLSGGRARVAAVLVAVDVELILYGGLVMTELLAGLGVLGAVWAALALRPLGTANRRAEPGASKGRHWRMWLARWRSPRGRLLGAGIASGLVTGLTTLVHPQTVLLAPLLGWTVASPPRSPWRARLKQAALVTIVTLALVAPWTVRNCRVMDGCAFVSSNGGWNLAIGAVPRATGRFVTLHSTDGCRVVTGQVQQDRCWSKLAVRHILRDPARWLRLAPRKLSYCFDHASFAVEYFRQADPRAWPEARRVRWRDGLLRLRGVLWSLAALAFLGRSQRTLRGAVTEATLGGLIAGLIVFGWTSSSLTFWPLVLALVFTGLWSRKSAPPSSAVDRFALGYFLVFLVLHVVFFGEDRYHVPLVPWAAMFAAAIMRKAAGSFKSGLPRRRSA